jgi:hypothetical protein
MGQKGDQLIHRGKFGGVADEATFPLSSDQSNAVEVGKVE